MLISESPPPHPWGGCILACFDLRRCEKETLSLKTPSPVGCVLYQGGSFFLPASEIETSLKGISPRRGVFLRSKYLSLSLSLCTSIYVNCCVCGLQYVAESCSVLQCVAVCCALCSVLAVVCVRESVCLLQYVAVWSSMLQRVAMSYFLWNLSLEPRMHVMCLNNACLLQRNL